MTISYNRPLVTNVAKNLQWKKVMRKLKNKNKNT